MFRKPAKATPEASPESGPESDRGSEAPAAPKKRSKLMLALLGAVPLVLAGGGYGGWVFFLAAPAADAHAADGAPEAEGHGEADPMQVAALPPEIAAETSFTHSFALSVLMRDKCGDISGPALKAASDEEAHADGMLVSLSWQSAARRAVALEARSCGHISAEIDNAEMKAEAMAAAKEKAAKGDKAQAAHH